MTIKSGSKEYYDFFCRGKRDLGLKLQMLASNYQFRVTVSELDQEGIWGYTEFDGFLDGEDVPKVVKAWSIELDWCDNIEVSGTTRLTSVFGMIIKNIGKKVVFHWDETNKLFCVVIIDPNHVEEDVEDDDYYSPPTPKEIEELEEIRRETEIDRLIEAGLFDPETGEFSSEYYRLSDIAYDCARERRYQI
jgi:hypothetical protein